jgi:hypothetical protein
VCIHYFLFFRQNLFSFFLFNSESVKCQPEDEGTVVSSLEGGIITEETKIDNSAHIEIIYDVFLSHDWGVDEEGRNTHERVSRVNNALRKRGIKTWFDNNKLEGPLRPDIETAISRSNCILIFVTKRYSDKIGRSGDRCSAEFNFIIDHISSRSIQVVVMEKRMKMISNWGRRLSFEIGSVLYTEMLEDDSSVFELQCDQLTRRIKRNWEDQTRTLEDPTSPLETVDVPTVASPVVENNTENFDNQKYLQNALNQGKKEWRRSKIMIVGEGRAGKTALANSILGRDYENLDSTIGINEFTCSVGFAGIGEPGSSDQSNTSWKELQH